MPNWSNDTDVLSESFCRLLSALISNVEHHELSMQLKARL